MNGFIWFNNEMSFTDMADAPLTTAFHGAIGGSIAMVGADFVRDIFPTKFRWIPSVLLIGSLGVIISKRVGLLVTNRKKMATIVKNRKRK